MEELFDFRVCPGYNHSGLPWGVHRVTVVLCWDARIVDVYFEVPSFSVQKTPFHVVYRNGAVCACL